MDPHGQVKASVIGTDLPVDESSTVLELHLSRIKKIENLENCTQLKKLSLVSNVIYKIENLESNLLLEHLDLYQNKISKIENINHLVHLKILDLSFNEIERIEGIDSLVGLVELYLSNNKIVELENLKHLEHLTLLEVGSNRIRNFGQVEHLKKLESLWMGRNKLGHMNIPKLPHLTRCSLQSNRIKTWDPCLLENIPNIQELYLGCNKLETLDGLVANLKQLRILDVSDNGISHIDDLNENTSIEELWLNDNMLDDLKQVEALKPLKNLRVLYLERNPLQQKLGPSYRTCILQILPRRSTLNSNTVLVDLTQLDAVEVPATVVAAVVKEPK